VAGVLRCRRCRRSREAALRTSGANLLACCCSHARDTDESRLREPIRRPPLCLPARSSKCVESEAGCLFHAPFVGRDRRLRVRTKRRGSSMAWRNMNYDLFAMDTAWRRFEKARHNAPSLLDIRMRALEGSCAALNLTPEAVHLAAEIAGFEPDLDNDERITLIVLVLVSLG